MTILSTCYGVVRSEGERWWEAWAKHAESSPKCTGLLHHGTCEKTPQTGRITSATFPLSDAPLRELQVWVICVLRALQYRSLCAAIDHSASISKPIELSYHSRPRNHLLAWIREELLRAARGHLKSDKVKAMIHERMAAFQ